MRQGGNIFTNIADVMAHPLEAVFHSQDFYTRRRNERDKEKFYNDKLAKYNAYTKNNANLIPDVPKGNYGCNGCNGWANGCRTRYSKRTKLYNDRYVSVISNNAR